MSAQERDTFTEAEVYRALSWGMSDTAARRLARAMADDPALIDSLPERKALEPSVTMYSDDMLLLLSLVSESAKERAEGRLAAHRLETELSTEERADWEARRADLKRRLVAAGKAIPDL